jgi:uncharacterized protein DUF5320
MPRGDRTGPWGGGPRTGRGLGYCTGNDRPGYMQAGPGLGLGGGMGLRRGWGGGRGWGRGFGGYGRARYGFWGRGYGAGPWATGWGAPMPAPVPEEEVSDLKAQATWLQEQMDMIQARMDELTGKSGEE